MSGPVNLIEIAETHKQAAVALADAVFPSLQGMAGEEQTAELNIAAVGLRDAVRHLCFDRGLDLHDADAMAEIAFRAFDARLDRLYGIGGAA